MVKNVEYYIGIFGGLFGMVDILFYGQHLHMTGANSEGLVLVMLTLHGVAMLLSCFVTKVNAIVYGVTMTVIGIASLYVFALGLYVPAILEIVSGCLSFRKVRQEPTV
ncbi:hypothetical protein [Bacillus thuringiensis]|uniref:hypothetical protein n=1 Tax=Bacillus thuringiensis TaxID=1428 RepID=UPI000BFB41C8|nr:hypothetical protein [Bacillus thuringiensis]PGT89873.1 hypothetical protein COD17_08980 [Bacillus thuringiensis]